MKMTFDISEPVQYTNGHNLNIQTAVIGFSNRFKKYTSKECQMVTDCMAYI